MTGRPGAGSATAGVALSVLALLGGCARPSCDELPALQGQRAAERAAYLELVRSGAPPQETTAADDALHTFERRVYELEQRCAGR